MFTSLSRALFPFGSVFVQRRVFVLPGKLLLQLVSDSSPCLPEHQQLRQESLRGLHDLVTLVDRLKVMDSI